MVCVIIWTRKEGLDAIIKNVGTIYRDCVYDTQSDRTKTKIEGVYYAD